MSKTKKVVTKKKFVVVTTDNTRRGVFGGYLESYDQDKAIAILSQARMAVYWSVETKGVLGLASIGPQKGSKITPAVPSMEINGVTSVMDATKGAEKQWATGMWD
jgi:hypothetical protein